MTEELAPRQLSTDPNKWLQYAERKIDAAETLLAAGEGHSQHSAFWIQEAAKMVVGAVLVADGTKLCGEPRLEELCDALAERCRSFSPQAELRSLAIYDELSLEPPAPTIAVPRAILEARLREVSSALEAARIYVAQAGASGARGG